MLETSLDKKIENILKKIFLVVVGSGLISNALYIYGLSYYEGYLESLGFEYKLFPIKWEDALLWTYSASRELGASTVSFWTKITGPMILVIGIVVYCIARIWMSINSQKKKKSPKLNIARLVVKWRRATPLFFKLTYPPVKWLLIVEHSVWAFLASYFFLVFMFAIPVFMISWVYFPLIGFHHGERVGHERLEQYREELCGGKHNYWNKCLRFHAEDSYNNSSMPEIEGRLIIRNGDILGLLTPSGPVTITLPKTLFQVTTENQHFERSSKDI